MSFKHWQAWGIKHLSRKPVPGFDHPFCEEMLPNIQSEPPLTQLWTITKHPITGSQGQEFSTVLSTSPPLEAAESNEVAPQPPFLQTRVFSHSSQDIPSSPSTIFVALLWTHLRTLTSFLNCGAQNFTQYSRWGLISAKYSSIITSFARLVMLSLMHPRMQIALLAARAHCWLTLSLLSTSTYRSLPAGLLSSHTSLNLDLCLALLCPRCRVWHMDR